MRRTGYVLHVSAEDLDSAQFEKLVATARHLPAEARAAQLAAALGMRQGPAYADFSTHSFARGEAGRLNELRLHD